MSTPLPAPLVVLGERGRTRRQLGALAIMLLVMLAQCAAGVWFIVASHQQYPGRAEAWIGTGLGAMFALVALAALVSGIEGWRRIVRGADGRHPVLVVDESGWTVDGADPVPWSAIDRIVVHGTEPPARRSTALAALDAGFTTRRAVKRSLDRAVGLPSGLRDGTRYATADLHDGTKRTADLSQAVAPEGFPQLADAIAAHAAAHDVRCSVTV